MSDSKINSKIEERKGWLKADIKRAEKSIENCDIRIIDDAFSAGIGMSRAREQGILPEDVITEHLYEYTQLLDKFKERCSCFKK